MLSNRSAAIAQSFGARAETYDDHADLQRTVATRLARLLPQLAAPRVLELGCGTGLFSRHLLARYPDGTFLFTDLAPSMMIGWQSDTQDSANFYEFLVMTPDAKSGYGQYNAGNYSNPEVDRLTLETQSMTDPKARAEVLRKIERILYDDAALVPLHWQHLSWAAAKTVHIAPVLNIIEFPYLGDLVME